MWLDETLNMIRTLKLILISLKLNHIHVWHDCHYYKQAYSEWVASVYILLQIQKGSLSCSI